MSTVFRRSVLWASNLILLAAIISPTAVSAQSSQSTCNAITRGLWAGINLNVRLNSCPSSTRTTSTQKPTPSNSGIYAALGDSVAAGQGLTPSDNDTRCDRSNQAYPNKVAAARKLQLLHIACSGATVGDLTTSQGVDGPNIPAQLPAAFAKGAPNLITITAGANDVHWYDFMYKCYQYTCGTNTDTTVISGLRTAMQAKLEVALYDITRRSDGHPPRVVITGYYNPLSTTCIGKQTQFTKAELTWVDTQVKALNRALQDTTKKFSFARFAPVSFSGHDVCSPESWVQSQTDTAPLHPNAAGQNAIAGAIVRAL